MPSKLIYIDSTSVEDCYTDFQRYVGIILELVGRLEEPEIIEAYKPNQYFKDFNYVTLEKFLCINFFMEHICEGDPISVIELDILTHALEQVPIVVRKKVDVFLNFLSITQNNRIQEIQKTSKLIDIVLEDFQDCSKSIVNVLNEKKNEC